MKSTLFEKGNLKIKGSYSGDFVGRGGGIYINCNTSFWRECSGWLCNHSQYKIFHNGSMIIRPKSPSPHKGFLL